MAIYELLVKRVTSPLNSVTLISL